MPTFSVAIPDKGASKTTTLRLLKNSFGDGYVQRVKDGLNYRMDVWNLDFTVRSQAIVESIRNFFETQDGDPFDWTTPEGRTQKFVCESWSITPDYATNWSIRAKFEQDFSL